MKKTIYTFLLSLSFIALFTTCKNPGIDYNTFSITEENIQPGAHNVMVSGEYDFLGEVISMTLSIGLNEQLTDAESHSMNLEGKSFSIAVDSLNPSTSYYYCYVVEFGNNYKLLTDVGIFKTLSERPVVRTIEANVVDSTTISVKCIVENSIGMAITERGICWNHTGNPQINNSHVTHQESDLGEYICEITSAELDVPYYVRAYAKSDIGLSYADEVLQITIEKPTVETLPIDTTGFTQTSAYCWGRIINEGSSPVIERGICWGITSTPNADGNYSYSNSNDTIFYVLLTNLSPNTTYYFCAYATNNEGTGYGNIIKFTTMEQNLFRIEVSCSPDEGQVEGGGDFVEGTNCTVKATANSHYVFMNWTEGGVVVSGSANYTFPVESNRTLIANFLKEKYSITAIPNPSNGGTIQGEGQYEYNQTCNLMAEPNEGYKFDNWTDNDGNLVSTNNPYSFAVTGDEQLVANFIEVPGGVINGLFTVGSSSKVYFSRGNLQYKAYPIGAWQFAPNQWNRVGTFNSNISPSYSGWIDLFGWGSGADPTNTGTINEFIDWGENQILCNGEIVSGPWRTLLKEEWDYVLNGRHASTINGVEDARYVKAKVNDVGGVILFPDEYEHPDEILIQTNTINNSGISFDNGNSYSQSQWLLMESKGCVFLPVTGKRDGITIQILDSGCYWSCTKGEGKHAYGLHFDASTLQINEAALKLGESVRLVCDY